MIPLLIPLPLHHHAHSGLCVYRSVHFGRMPSMRPDDDAPADDAPRIPSEQQDQFLLQYVEAQEEQANQPEQHQDEPRQAHHQPDHGHDDRQDGRQEEEAKADGPSLADWEVRSRRSSLGGFSSTFLTGGGFEYMQTASRRDQTESDQGAMRCF